MEHFHDEISVKKRHFVSRTFENIEWCEIREQSRVLEQKIKFEGFDGFGNMWQHDPLPSTYLFLLLDSNRAVVELVVKVHEYPKQLRLKHVRLQTCNHDELNKTEHNFTHK